MSKPRLLACLCVFAAFGLQAASASADPTGGPPICPGTESAVSGNYKNLTITGDQYVPDGTTLNVSRNLTIAPGACFDAFTLGTVNVARNVSVGSNAIFALGCTPGSIGPGAPCDGMTTDDTVGGNITANGALTMYLDGDTIHGNVTSTGGGPGPTFDPYINFPIKDNTINGNVSVSGWQGAWVGLLRNTVGKNVSVTDNVGVAIGDLGTPDSTEVATNTIAGNLICQGNSPAAQLGDSGGSDNTVGKKKIGECAGL
jgi:hypothetical protein